MINSDKLVLLAGQATTLICFAHGPEVRLPAGDVTEGVVRIGATVRRPRQQNSDAIAAYLEHLYAGGFETAPRALGIDRRGRDVLTFVPGRVAGSPVEAWARADAVMPGVGTLLRRLLDASDGWQPPVPFASPPGRPLPRFPDGEALLVSHRDLTPQNIAFREDVADGLFDFDLSGWTTRLTELANTALHWVPLCDPVDRGAGYEDVDVAARLRLLVEGYGRESVDIPAFLDAAALRFDGAYTSMQWNAQHLGGGWARMWDEGAGAMIQRRVAWFARVRDELARTL